jgi:hypothetical protein
MSTHERFWREYREDMADRPGDEVADYQTWLEHQLEAAHCIAREAMELYLETDAQRVKAEADLNAMRTSLAVFVPGLE